MEKTNAAALQAYGQASLSLAWPSGEIWRRLRIWQQRARGRRHLATFDDRMLKDIGITRADVQRECRKPFWQE